MTSDTASALAAFNALDPDAAGNVLLGCCASRDWARSLAARRPFRDADALYDAADTCVAELGSGAMAQALAGHPRIGERPTGPGHESSAREQAGVIGARRRVLDEIAEGNARYEDRFGHVYLVCATGRSADELLAVLRERLDNDAVTEDRVTRTELAKINRIRLGRMLQEAPWRP